MRHAVSVSSQRRLVTAIGGASDDSNAPFSLEDQKEIALRLAEIQTYVRKTYQLNESQYEAIDARLDYFAEAAKRLGRIDWRNAFIGAFLGAVLQSYPTSRRRTSSALRCAAWVTRSA